MNEFQIGLVFLPCLFLTLFIGGMIAETIKKKRTEKARNTSSIHCHHCGAPMLENDVFCKNCWKITPKIQEMLNRHPERKPEFYSNLNKKNKLCCPHCKAFHRYPRRYYESNILDSPIKYCPQCHNYFLDRGFTEWSVTPVFIKFLEFFPVLHILFCFPFLLLIIDCIIENDLLMARDFTLLFLAFIGIHSAFAFTSYIVSKRSKFKKSNMRLEQNPEYPKILIDMGYWEMMSKEYYPLSKEPLSTRRDKLKELLKEAFTFD